MNNCKHTVLLILLLSTCAPAHAMDLSAQRKLKFSQMRLLWNALESTEDTTAETITASTLKHTDFVAAILIKLEEKQYPILPQEQRTFLTTWPMQILYRYCAEDNNARALLQQEMNKIAADNRVEFRQACFTFFQLLAKHAPLTITHSEEQIAPQPSAAILRED